MNRFFRAAKTWDLARLNGLAEEAPRRATQVDRSGRTALHYAAGHDLRRTGDDPTRGIAVADWLLDRGADIDAVQPIPDDGEIFPARPVWHAYARGHNRPLTAHLLGLGASPDSCLWAVAWNDDAEAARLFLDQGAALEERIHGETPFLYACAYRRFAVAQVLAERGADVNARMPDGATALHVALRKRFRLAEIDTLLGFGIDPATPDAAGESAIDLAERLGKTGALTRLKSG